jgi:hypothetical protein
LCEDYHAKDSEEHDEYEEADVGAFFGAVRGRARAPLHRSGTTLASTRDSVTARRSLHSLITIHSLGPRHSHARDSQPHARQFPTLT